MISGTSTGAILGGALAAGVPAAKVRDLYLNDGPALFDPRFFLNPKRWLEGKYDRKKFREKIGAVIGDMTHRRGPDEVCRHHVQPVIGPHAFHQLR